MQKHYSMQLFSIGLLLILVSCSYANEFEIRKKVDNVSAMMVNLIRDCYSPDQVVLSGDWSDADFHKISTINPRFSVKIIGLKEDVHFKNHKRLNGSFKMTTRIIRKKKYPGKNVIIIVRSNDTLHAALVMLKKSLLWNHEASFLIICKNVEDQCRTAHSYLTLTWSFHILSAVLLCTNGSQALELYTFNPFTSRAPELWSLSQRDERRNDSLTFYKRMVDVSLNECCESICKDLKFDRTKNLGGYPMKIGVFLHPNLIPYDKRKSEFARFGGLDGETFQVIWEYFNATGKIKYYSKPGLVEEEGLLQKFLRDLIPNKIEIAMNGNLLRDFWKLQTYPHDSEGYCIVSRKDSVTQISVDFRLVYGFKGVGLVLIVSSMTLIILKYHMKITLSLALLELIRMIVMVPIHFKLQYSLNRMIIISTFTLIVVLHTYVYCSWISFKVEPRRNPTIDTETDLIRTNMNIYGTLNYNQHLSDLDIKKRYRYGQVSDCMNRLLRGRQIICIAQCSEVMFDAYEGKVIHVSRNFRRFFRAYSISEDWPFYSKINKILMRLSQGGLVVHFKRKQSYRFSQRRHKIDNNLQVSLENMMANWLIWIGGMTLATIVFIIELFSFDIAKTRQVLRKKLLIMSL